MKHQINKLANLALDYAEFAKKARLPLNTITALSTGIGVHPTKWAQRVGLIIKVWVGDNYNTCTIYFGEIEFRLYNGTMVIPFDMDAEKMESAHEKAKFYLDNFLNTEALIDEIKREAEDKIKEQIEQLKKQLL